MTEKNILITDIIEAKMTEPDTGSCIGWLAEHLLKVGWRKIPEGAIILTKEEIAALNEYQKKHCTGGEPLEEQVPQQK